MLEFHNKTAVVTGAGGEVGRATACLLASRGANVLAVDVDKDALVTTLAGLNDINPKGTYALYQADVGHADDVAAYAQQAADLADSGIDVFFNSAGIEGPKAALIDYPEDAFDKVIKINVRGLFLGLKYVLAKMNDGGSIVNIASVSGLGSVPNLVAYVASKHAMIGMTKLAALEAAKRNIRVNAICSAAMPPMPAMQGYMTENLDDSLGQDLSHSFDHSFDQRADDGLDPSSPDDSLGLGIGLDEDNTARPTSQRRYGTPDEIARFVLLLLSDEADYITGGIFPINGGLQIR